MERTRKKVRVRCRHVTRGSRERYSFRRYISPPIPLIHRPPPSLRFPPLGLSPPAHHEEEVHEHVEFEGRHLVAHAQPGPTTPTDPSGGGPSSAAALPPFRQRSWIKFLCVVAAVSAGGSLAEQKRRAFVRLAALARRGVLSSYGRRLRPASGRAHRSRGGRLPAVERRARRLAWRRRPRADAAFSIESTIATAHV